MKYGENYRRDAPAMIKAGLTLPAPWLHVPINQGRYAWVYDAFNDLSTCRQFGFGAAPIPWTAIVEYIDRNEIRESDEFLYLIRVMDSEYLKYVKENNEKD